MKSLKVPEKTKRPKAGRYFGTLWTLDFGLWPLWPLWTLASLDFLRQYKKICAYQI